GGQSRACLDAVLDSPGDGGRLTEQCLALGDVEIRLIQREALDERRDLMKHPENLPRYLAVALHPGGNANGVRAEAQRRMHRHGRAHAESADLVARRRDHSAPAGPSDDDWFADELRVIPLLYRRIKGVH